MNWLSIYDVITLQDSAKLDDVRPSFATIPLDDLTDQGKKKKKLPRRVLYFSDGVLEEYSTDEDEVAPKSQPQTVVDPVSLVLEFLLTKYALLISGRYHPSFFLSNQFPTKTITDYPLTSYSITNLFFPSRFTEVSCFSVVSAELFVSIPKIIWKKFKRVLERCLDTDRGTYGIRLTRMNHFHVQ